MLILFLFLVGKEIQAQPKRTISLIKASYYFVQPGIPSAPRMKEYKFVFLNKIGVKIEAKCLWTNNKLINLAPSASTYKGDTLFINVSENLSFGKTSDELHPDKVIPKNEYLNVPRPVKGRHKLLIGLQKKDTKELKYFPINNIQQVNPINLP